MSGRLVAKGALLSASFSFLTLGRNISSVWGGASLESLTFYGVLASVAFGALVSWDWVLTRGRESTVLVPRPSTAGPGAGQPVPN